MKKNKIFILLYILLLSGLFALINHDLFRFSYEHHFSSIYHSNENEKGDYSLHSLTLKGGEYVFQYKANAPSRGCAVFISDSDGQFITEIELLPQITENKIPFTIKNSGTYTVGVHYDTTCETLEIEEFSIHSDHVFVKEALLRHSILSLVLIIVWGYIGIRLFLSEKILKRFPKLPEAERIFLFLCVLTALVSIPYFIPGRCMTGDDFDFHLSRIKGMAASLKAGYFPPKIYLDWMYDYGAGVGFYYPDTFLLIPAVMQLLGFSLITAYKAFCVLISFFTGLTAFLCASQISGGNQKIGFAAAILYVFAPYRLICLIYRCALGEALGFIFLPLVIWGLYEIFTGHPEKWFLFAFGFLGLLGSHLISLAIAGILTAIFLLLKIRMIVQRKSILSAILKAAIVTFLLGAFFLLPFAEQTLKNDLYFNHQVLLEENRGIVPQNLHKFSNLFIIYDNWEFEENRVKPYPGLLLLLIPLLRVLFIHRKNTAISMADHLTLSGFALLIISTEIFPWELFLKPLLLRIQYSWRLLQPATIFLCLSGSIYLYELNAEKSRLIIGIIFILCFAFAAPIFKQTIQNRTLENDFIRLEFQELNAYEYTPVGATWKYADEHRNNTVCEDPSAEISNQKKSGLSYRFSYRLDQEKDVRFSLPYMFYASYAGTLTTPDGEEIPLSFYQDENGLLAFRNNGIPEGNVAVHYEKTITQKTGEIISLCTLLALCLMMRQADNSGHKHVLPGNTTSSARRLTVRLSPRGRRPFDVKEARHCRE